MLLFDGGGFCKIYTESDCTLLLLTYIICMYHLLVCLMVFNATLNNISVISWQSGLLMEETGVPRENHRHVAICSTLTETVEHFLRTYEEI